MGTAEKQNGGKFDGNLGFFCWWDLDKTQIKPDDLRTILAAESWVPGREVPDIDAGSALTRACSEWSQGRGGDTRYRAEVTRSDSSEITVGILVHERVDDKTVKWVQCAYLTFDVANRAFTATHATHEKHDASVAAYLAVATERLTYLDHRYIRPSILMPALDAMSAISIRKQGGIYYVPNCHEDDARHLARVIRAIGNSDFLLATVASDDDSRKAIGSAARDTTVEAVGAVMADLGEWRESARKIRTDSQRNVFEELASLLQRAELYEDALSISLDDLKGQIETTRQEAMAILADKANLTA